MALVIRLREKTAIPVEVDAIEMGAVRTKSAAEVAATLIQYGNKQVPLGEFFDVSGSASDERIVWQGDCSHVKLIGARLSSGEIRVDGNAGMHLGAEMTGGQIEVDGNATDWVGAEMHGGRIRVRGNVGHLVGAVYRGGRKGMTNGEIVVHGNAGNEVGHSMRRGLIAIGGRVGDALGVNMIAGTLVALGECGIRPGAGMRRGTILLAGDAPPPGMLPTFRYACTHAPVVVRLILSHLRTLGCAVPRDAASGEFHRYCGDLLEMGKGEILTRATLN